MKGGRWGTRFIAWLAWTLNALVELAARLRSSHTGRANPRVARLRGGLGYYARSYRLTQPTVDRWLAQGGELFPAIVQVQTINRCNATCPMCPYPTTVALEPRRVMADGLFSRIATECAAAPELVDFVPMSQNEALLDRKLPARIAEFKRQARPDQVVELVTNGSLLTPARLMELEQAGLDLLTISVNADQPATYAALMPGLAWERLVTLLEHLAAQPPPRVNVYLRYIRQRENVREFRGFARRWGRHFNLMVYDVNNRGGAVKDFADRRLALNGVQRGFRKWLGPRLFKLCPYVFSHMAVLQNGDVLLCGNDWQTREVVGNANTQSLRAIYNSPRMQEVRQLMVEGRYDEIPACRGCSFRHEWF